MTLKPTGHYILVYKTKTKETEEEGILIPDAVSNGPLSGIIVDVGPSVENFTQGDTVLLPKDGVINITLEKVDYVILSEDEILGIFK